MTDPLSFDLWTLSFKNTDEECNAYKSGGTVMVSNGHTMLCERIGVNGASCHTKSQRLYFSNFKEYNYAIMCVSTSRNYLICLCYL